MRVGWIVAVVALGCSGSCGTSKPKPGGPASPTCVVQKESEAIGASNVRVETLVTGLKVPWSLAFLPNGDLLVTEREGRIRVVRASALLPEPIANVDAAATGEGGLLGLALHPDFAKNRWFFVYYGVNVDGGVKNRVERWVLGEDGKSAKPDRVIVEGIPAARYHDGGRLHFGPDGFLWIATGDAANPDAAQDPSSLAGKILRVDSDGNAAPGNPFGRAVVLGIRNVQGFDFFDASTLVVADHGPSGELGGRRGHDEISIAKIGANLGWPTIWGCEAREGLVSPLVTWERAVPPGGATLYRGDLLAEWKNSLLVAALADRSLHRIGIVDGKRTLHEVYFAGEPPKGYGRLRDVATGPDGAVYLTTSNCDGRGTCPKDGDRILRIVR